MPVDDFIRLASLDYEHWRRSNAEKARRLLAEHPEIARADIYAASAAGDVVAAREFLDHQPALVNARGGPFDWEPLLYACYSRVGSTLDVARLLLERGADPNAQFLWHGNLPPFTALTGAFGEGESTIDQPPHPDRDALAKLLLDAGADPDDEQTLYNRHFNRNDDHLKLLFSYGLGRTEAGRAMLVEELWQAARKNYFDRVKLLVDHGTDVNAPGRRDGRTPYETAMLAGHHDIAAYLLEHGAKTIELSPADAFVAACVAGRRDEALAMLKDDPALLDKLGPHGRVELPHRAMRSGRPESVRLVAELGLDLNGMVPNTGLDRSPLHDAAWGGNLEMVKLLLELGADPELRDPTYHGTPRDWAAHNEKQHIVDWLRGLEVSESRSPTPPRPRDPETS